MNYCLTGAILGDIIGSWLEYEKPEDYDYKTANLFCDECFFTDDTVLSLATKYAIENGISFSEAYRHFVRLYPDKGYGNKFYSWAMRDYSPPYNSYGNGSAMRVSYIADYSVCCEELYELADCSAACTHNHPEGVKGAMVTAESSLMALIGRSKEDIRKVLLKNYGEEIKLNERRPTCHYDATCWGSVPLAIQCFLESDSYESCLRNVLSVECDTDTVAAIAGSIAGGFYKKFPCDVDTLLREKLDSRLYQLYVS